MISNARPSHLGRKAGTIAAVFAISLIFLLRFRTDELSGVSIGNAISVLDPHNSLAPFWYPPHLLLNPVLRGVYIALAGTGCDVLCAGQLHGMLWGAIAVTTVFLILFELTGATGWALFGSFTLLVSNAFWVYSYQLGSYVGIVACILLIIYFLMHGTGRWLPWLLVVSVALTWALATFYHQSNALLVIPITLFLVLRQGTRGWKTSILISVASGTLVLVGFVLAYLSADPQLPFLNWVLHLAATPLTDWGSFGNFGLKGLQRAMYSQVTSILALPDEIRPYQLPLQWRGTILIFGVLVWNLLFVFRRAGEAAPRVLLLSCWLVLFSFFVWWDPRVHKFFLPSAVPLIVLGVLTLRDLWRAASSRLGTVSLRVGKALMAGLATTTVMVMFSFTLVGSIAPLRKSSGQALGPHYRTAIQMRELAPASRSCDIYGYGHQLTNLVYYLGWKSDRVRTEREMYEAYRRWRLVADSAATRGPDRWFKDESCAVIDFHHLSKVTFNDRVGTYMPSERWESFLTWFLRSVPGTEDSVIQVDWYEFLPPSDGRASTYVLIDRTTRVSIPRDSLQARFSAIKDTFDNAAFPGRDRRLIFGYSGNTNSVSHQASFSRALIRAFR